MLHETYGHRPVYFARFEGEKMSALLPVMEVSSPLTGRRGVSLPFTDACAALGDGRAKQTLFQAAVEEGKRRHWKYLECRRWDGAWEGATPSLGFYEHKIDLTVGAERLFAGMDSAMRRSVRKAQGAGLEVEFGGAPELMDSFYKLHCRTRRRHGVPPQPIRFFRNIQRHLLASGQGFIALVSRQGQALAAAVFLCFGRRALYKFGASDFRGQNLRPSNLLMWAGLRKCAEEGFDSLNLGRTGMSNQGLRRFKAALGGSEQLAQYARYEFKTETFIRDADRAEGWHNRFFASLPLPALRLAGEILYPCLS